MFIRHAIVTSIWLRSKNFKIALQSTYMGTPLVYNQNNRTLTFIFMIIGPILPEIRGKCCPKLATNGVFFGRVKMTSECMAENISRK